MNEKQKEILMAFRTSITNYQEALRLTGLPEPLIELYVTNIPDFSKLLPDDVLGVYKDIRVMVILYLDALGFSQREIGRRIVSPATSVRDIIKQYKPSSNRATIDDVTNKKKENL